MKKKIGETKQEYGMRILGPNCLGIINPSKNLNASIADQMPETGREAFLSQSGSLASSILDWAISAQFGFSGFVSVGNMLDIDFGDLIDYFGRDRKTKSILMYVEVIKDARKFMSAARRFVRIKPIIAVKSGKHKQWAQPVVSRVGSLAVSDEVYDSAFQRAGIIRVDSIEGLFTCSEILAKHNLPRGPSLAIVTNAGGPGIMAADALIDQGGRLAGLSDSTVEILRKKLPSRVSLSNPIDVTRDANPEDYRVSVKACLKDENVDGILCIYAPQGQLGPENAAEAIGDLLKTTRKPILACWMGGEKVQRSREILRQYGFSVQSFPEESVKGLMYLNRYARNLERLLETPEKIPIDRVPPKYHLKAMIERIARDDRELLTGVESKKILRTYNIPTPEIHIARSPEEAEEYASKVGFPVVLKIYSYDITHKSEVGGVALDICSKSEVKRKFGEIIEQAKENCPTAGIEGVTVQRMIEDKSIELILGSKRDPLFGSVLVFGRGGTDVEYCRDFSIGLPPLNQTLARMLMEDTKVHDQLKGSKDFLPDSLRMLEEYLVRLSQLIIDFPEIKEFDIDPLARVGDEFLALDARIIIDKDLALGKPEPNENLIIEPYPRKYIEEWRLNDGRSVTIRPVRPEDEPLMFELWKTFSKDTVRYRFFSPIRELTHEDMVSFVNLDYRREMAMVGELIEDGERKIIGISRLVIDPDGNSGEIGVIIGDPWQGLGLGEKLVDSIIGVAEDRNLGTVRDIVLSDNRRMINLSKKLGFEVEERDRNTIVGVLKLK